MEQHPPLVLHSSPWRLGLQLSGPVLLTVLAIATLTRGVNLVGVLLALAAVGLGAVVAFDLPLRTEFDEQGLRRVCLLRRVRLEWSEVVAIERFGARPLRRGTDRPAAGSRGLAARTGPRRLHLLVDRRESHAEWSELARLLRERGTQLRAAEPALDAPPAGRGPRALHRRS